MKADLEIRENLGRYPFRGIVTNRCCSPSTLRELTFYTTCQNRKRRLEESNAPIIVTKVYEVCYDSQTAGLDL
jgi:hypothetical protein